MVLRSHVRGGRSTAAIVEVETRPDMESGREIENPLEVVILADPTADGDLGTARPAE